MPGAGEATAGAGLAVSAAAAAPAPQKIIAGINRAAKLEIERERTVMTGSLLRTGTALAVEGIDHHRRWRRYPKASPYWPSVLPILLVDDRAARRCGPARSRRDSGREPVFAIGAHSSDAAMAAWRPAPARRSTDSLPGDGQGLNPVWQGWRGAQDEAVSAYREEALAVGSGAVRGEVDFDV